MVENFEKVENFEYIRKFGKYLGILKIEGNFNTVGNF
jgi:hypothetical protein